MCLSGENEQRNECKCENINESQFLKYVRLACDDGMFFLKAEWKTQMKKAISFTIDACLHVDGCVVECQCECAVNVCVVLLALQKFSESGDLITEETSSKISEHFTMLDHIREVLLKLNICL